MLHERKILKTISNENQNLILKLSVGFLSTFRIPKYRHTDTRLGIHTVMCSDRQTGNCVPTILEYSIWKTLIKLWESARGSNCRMRILVVVMFGIASICYFPSTIMQPPFTRLPTPPPPTTAKIKFHYYIEFNSIFKNLFSTEQNSLICNYLYWTD